MAGIIAGKEATPDEPLQRSAEDLPVEFAGFIPPRDLFDRIDVLIVPSIWAEPLPRTILEAYAMGVPVIGADLGGIPDLIGPDNRDWLFPPGDDLALSAAMQRVLCAGREALPARASFDAVVSDTRPDKVARRYLDLYEAVRRDGVRAPAPQTARAVATGRG